MSKSRKLADAARAEIVPRADSQLGPSALRRTPPFIERAGQVELSPPSGCSPPLTPPSLKYPSRKIPLEKLRGMWIAQTTAHLVRDEGVAGSNPATPTNTSPDSRAPSGPIAGPSASRTALQSQAAAPMSPSSSTSFSNLGDPLSWTLAIDQNSRRARSRWGPTGSALVNPPGDAIIFGDLVGKLDVLRIECDEVLMARLRKSSGAWRCPSVRPYWRINAASMPALL